MAGVAGTQAPALLSHGLCANVTRDLGGGCWNVSHHGSRKEEVGEGQTAEFPLQLASSKGFSGSPTPHFCM